MGSDAINERTGGAKPGLFGLFVDGLNAIGSIIIGLLMLMICADVASRSLFGRPIAGVSELTAMSIVIIVFLSLASTLRHGRMSRADLFIDGFLLRRRRAGSLLDALLHLIGAFTCALIVWATLPNLIEAWNRNTFVGVQGVFTVPTWPLRLAVIVGSATAALQFLTLAGAKLRTAVAPSNHTTEG